MKEYFYAENDQQFGPFSIEELKLKRLKKSTLVWTEGMPDWNAATNVDILKDFLISEPPPLPKKDTAKNIELIQFNEKVTHGTNAKYDIST